jgi:hypothetical protein
MRRPRRHARLQLFSADSPEAGSAASPSPYPRRTAATGDRFGGRQTPGDARIAVARTTLARHRISTDTARCEVCQSQCPCDAANAAANALASGGLLIAESEPALTAGAPASGRWRQMVRTWLPRLRKRVVADLTWPADY